MITRRNILGAAVVAGGAVLKQIALPGPNGASAADTAGAADGQVDRSAGQNTPMLPPGEPGRDYTPVFTPNGLTLKYKVVGGVKVMHLVAEQINHEFAPGLKARCWGYNGRTPGPTIEALQGDRLRIYLTNHLPAPTTVHWHGMRIPNGMDGVNGLTQPNIDPGQTFRYEFTVQDAGTFMYHPHFDEMTQQGLGMMGMFIVHPRQRDKAPADRDFAILLSEWRIDPGASRPNPIEMVDFNILTMNSKVYPATQPLVAKLGERVRIRFGNLGAMDHHPIHLHGFNAVLTETDGGAIPQSARCSANTVLVPVGSTRAIEFIADNPGDWAMHCHMTHHVMNQMGHGVPNMVGVKGGDLDKQITKLLPDYMTLGENGMGDMSQMQMPVPSNSIPMLMGKGQFGVIDMGGMFTIVKVREKLSGYEDPGDYNFPPGSVAAAATADELRRDGISLPDDSASADHGAAALKKHSHHHHEGH